LLRPCHHYNVVFGGQVFARHINDLFGADAPNDAWVARDIIQSQPVALDPQQCPGDAIVGL